MRKPWKRTAWIGVWLVVSGCQAPGMAGARRLSASEHSGAFASDSGNSSADSGNSSNGSGNSSDGSNSSEGSGDSSNNSGDSSNNSGESSNDSSNSSNEESSEESSNESTRNSTEESSDNSNSKNNPVSSASLVMVTAAALGLVVWHVTTRTVGPEQAPAPSPQQVARAAQTYLRSRTHQLREDLALGAGPTVEDLASLAGIRREHLGVFGRLLRAHRTELLALAETRTLTPERALAWLRRVGEIARTDPRLEEDRSAFLARLAGGEPGL